MIDLTVHPAQREANARHAAARGFRIPTFAQMIDPSLVPADAASDLRGLGLWDMDPRNLFRVTWRNEPVERGGGFGAVNAFEVPRAITGIDARIIGLCGKWFPTGAHKVGATTGCLAPRLVTGQFDPGRQKAVWPSTGNYCRGGAYIASLLGCESIAILPEEMSRERFEWLKQVAGEVIATPGCESNVKEIYDKCWELRRERGDAILIFNQFDEMGNYLWHHEVTGRAAAEAFQRAADGRSRLAAFVSSTGSAGTIAAGDYLKKLHPHARIVAGEALQCPTLLENGFGGHRIEGIGDKHVPWIHNVRNTDAVAAIDDEMAIRVMRLFNEPAGHEFLAAKGVADADLERLSWMGISCIGNMLGAIKAAKHFEMDADDVLVTVFTDSMDLYASRIEEERERRGAYTPAQAAVDHDRCILGESPHGFLELRHHDRKRIHNLKYYTWIEQQQRDVAELNAQWHDRDYWESIPRLRPEVDRLIAEFNDMADAMAAKEAVSS